LFTRIGRSIVKLISVFALILATSGFSAGLVTVGSDVAGMVLSLESPIPQFGSVELKGSNYTSLSLSGADNLAEVGLPRVPVYRAWIEIPIGATVDVQVTENRISTFDLPTSMPVEPGLPPVSKNLPRDSYTLQFDREVYISGSAFPSSWVRVINAGEMRGHNLALVEVMPVRWNPSDGTVQVLSSASITLSYVGGSVAQSYANSERYAATGFEHVLSARLANYGTFGTDSPDNDGAILIIAQADCYETAMDAFVIWKTRSGYPVTLVSTAEAGTTAAAIDAYIENALQTWAVPPEYVLLVGDVALLPAGSGTQTGGVTDLYYSCIGTADFIPDVFLGRFSVQTSAQAILMAQRVIDYETWNYTSGAWLQNTGWIGCLDPNWVMVEATHNYCIDEICTPMGYTADRLYPHTYGATPTDVNNSVNGGLSMLTFSGHGSSTSWGDMAYGQSDFNQLNNEGMFPGVLSHACNTGDYATGTCWAETWTRTAGRGGLWFWGSVPSSYWDEDDYMQRGEWESFIPTSTWWTMGFLNDGKMAVYDAYSGGGSTLYYFEAYNLMGDPSLEMWTWQLAGGVPGTLNVTHPASIDETGPVIITVAGATDDALVCIWKGDETYERGFTTGGSITLYASPETTGDMLVTVRRHNFKPYLGVITVTGLGVEGGGTTTPLQVSCANPLLASGVVAVQGQGLVTLEVYDLSGRIVANPFSGEIDGSLSVSLANANLSPGVYFLRLSGSGVTDTQRVTVLR
jgi:hypothetical protein